MPSTSVAALHQSTLISESTSIAVLLLPPAMRPLTTRATHTSTARTPRIAAAGSGRCSMRERKRCSTQLSASNPEDTAGPRVRGVMANSSSSNSMLWSSARAGSHGQLVEQQLDVVELGVDLELDLARAGHRALCRPDASSTAGSTRAPSSDVPMARRSADLDAFGARYASRAPRSTSTRPASAASRAGGIGLVI